ncbi:DUF6412 domain-containing protein [Streptomyces physcomitrii]|uniref:DUF6412 domain-containing protein n=1 Tax=Streptomyces physcomitrii TaxID=2724184 RepID=UPI0035E3F7B6
MTALAPPAATRSRRIPAPTRRIPAPTHRIPAPTRLTALAHPALLRRLLLPLLVVLSEVLFAEAGMLGAAMTLAATAAAGSLLALCALLAARAVPAVPHARVRTAIRDRARRTAFLPQRDPDAAGRPRPRAPGCRPVTAV